ncbi:hypothetical protein ACK39B_08625 [Aeromonas veronii]
MTQQGVQAQLVVLQHIYSSSYQTYVANGVACNTPNGRIELSFYADKARYMHEELEPVAGEPNRLKVREDVGIASQPIREHMTCVNMSVEDAQALYDLLGKVLTNKEL